MMHSKKVNAVVVVCDLNNKPLREYSVNSGVYSREADVYLPFDTEYKFLIKNNNLVRMKVEIDIDGASIGSPIIIDANSSVYIERFVDVANNKVSSVAYIGYEYKFDEVFYIGY